MIIRQLRIANISWEKLTWVKMSLQLLKTLTRSTNWRPCKRNQFLTCPRTKQEGSCQIKWLIICRAHVQRMFLAVLARKFSHWTTSTWMSFRTTTASTSHCTASVKVTWANFQLGQRTRMVTLKMVKLCSRSWAPLKRDLATKTASSNFQTSSWIELEITAYFKTHWATLSTMHCRRQHS
jgi:hypothetical protein